MKRKTISSLLIILTAMVFFACNQNEFAQGKRLYSSYCASCHMEDGTGLTGIIPPLKDADYYESNLMDIPCIIIHGLSDSILVNGRWYSQPMEGVKLTEVQITNVINYINTSWNNNHPLTSLGNVQKALEKCNQ